jgi:hypothetical protein
MFFCVNNLSFSFAICNSEIVYPNPAAEHIRFDYQANSHSIAVDIIDMFGNSDNSKVSDVNPGDNMIDFEISGVSSGSYILRIVDGKNISLGKVIIK